MTCVLTLAGALLDRRSDHVTRWLGRRLNDRARLNVYPVDTEHRFARETGLSADLAQLGCCPGPLRPVDVSLARPREVPSRAEDEHPLDQGLSDDASDSDSFIDPRPLEAAMSARALPAPA